MLSVNGNDAFLLADQVIDECAYHIEQEPVTWENCSLRSWLNQNFYKNAFHTDEQNVIKTTTVSNPGNPKYGTSAGNNTTDKVYLLSLEEAEDSAYGFYQDNYGYSDAYKANNTFYTGSVTFSDNHWWLRTPGNMNRNAGYVTSEKYGFHNERTQYSDTRAAFGTYYTSDRGLFANPGTKNVSYILRTSSSSSNGTAGIGEGGYVYTVSSGVSGIRLAMHISLSSGDWSYAGTVRSDEKISMPPLVKPTATPKPSPTVKPTVAPTAKPTVTPTVAPTMVPNVTPKPVGTAVPNATPKLAASGNQVPGSYIDYSV